MYEIKWIFIKKKKKIASRFVRFFTCVLEKLNKLAAKSTKINENTFYNVQPLLR